MTIQTAIKLAIEGGWDKEKRLNALGVIKSTESMCLDPQFWQCLGRAMDWPDPKLCEHPCGYIHYWHKFIDHLDEGKSIETYFENL